MWCARAVMCAFETRHPAREGLPDGPGSGADSASVTFAGAVRHVALALDSRPRGRAGTRMGNKWEMGVVFAGWKEGEICRSGTLAVLSGKGVLLSGCWGCSPSLSGLAYQQDSSRRHRDRARRVPGEGWGQRLGARDL